MTANELDEKRDPNTYNPYPVFLFEEEFQPPAPGSKAWPRPADRPRIKLDETMLTHPGNHPRLFSKEITPDE